MWEKDNTTSEKMASGGYTPTHVGKRVRFVIIITKRRVHSHACGKKVNAIRDHICQKGTLPRMWEKDSVFIG